MNRLPLVPITALLLASACGGPDDTFETATHSSALTRGTASYSVRDGDILLERDGRQIEILRLVVERGTASTRSLLTMQVPTLEYTCDNDPNPPQAGDKCQCDNNKPPILGNTSFDCLELEADCKAGSYDSTTNECSDWQGPSSWP
ncbi:MAG: hypothetical protein RIT81_05255 [Deltaproteobacteria bacterium]